MSNIHIDKASYYPVKKLEDMSLEEIKRKYIRVCAKANGDISVCSRCRTPCREGERVIQLKANEIYSDPPIPLYGGKTLIEKAREENERRRALASTESKKGKRKYKHIDDWYQKAMESGDPVKWVMDNYEISSTKAKAKLSNWKCKYLGKSEEKKEEKKEEKIEIVIPASEVSFEKKLEYIMKLQEEQKKEVEKYERLLNEAKEKYEAIKRKGDILCQAMDILYD